jgi:hypothetical protein
MSDINYTLMICYKNTSVIIELKYSTLIVLHYS